MSVIRRYNPISSQWEIVSVGAQGPQGIQGPTGPTGPTGPAGMYAGDEAPADTSLVWVDTDAPDNLALLQTELGVPGGVASLNGQGALSGAERPRAGLWLPGTAADYASTPESAALDITGDLDVRVLVSSEDWATGVDQVFMGRATGSTVRSFDFRVNDAGRLELWFLIDGVGYDVRTSSEALPVADGTPIWLRATLDVDNGVGGHTTAFYTSTDGVTWTQVGSSVVRTPAITLASTAAALWVGKIYTNLPFQGTVHRAQVYDGIDGTLVADFNADSPPSRHGTHPSAFTDSVGNVWTINGSDWEYRDDLGRTLATAAEAAASTPGVAGGVATLDSRLRVTERAPFGWTPGGWPDFMVDDFRGPVDGVPHTHSLDGREWTLLNGATLTEFKEFGVFGKGSSAPSYGIAVVRPNILSAASGRTFNTAHLAVEQEVWYGGWNTATTGTEHVVAVDEANYFAVGLINAGLRVRVVAAGVSTVLATKSLTGVDDDRKVLNRVKMVVSRDYSAGFLRLNVSSDGGSLAHSVEVASVSPHPIEAFVHTGLRVDGSNGVRLYGFVMRSGGNAIGTAG